MRINKKGFTLIELIIVIVIIGILAAIAAPMMGGMKAKAMCAEAVATLGTIRNAVRQYYVEYNAVPDYWNGGNFLDDDRFENSLSAAGLNVNNLRGLYGSKECYQFYIQAVPGLGLRGTISYFPRPNSYGGSPNDGVKHEEAENILDPDDDGNTFLFMDLGSGRIRQAGIPESGYPS